MDEKIYELIIPTDDRIGDASYPRLFANTVDELLDLARPWIEQEHPVILRAWDEDNYREYRED